MVNVRRKELSVAKPGFATIYDLVQHGCGWGKKILMQVIAFLVP
jgi:hypothetical protein